MFVKDKVPGELHAPLGSLWDIDRQVHVAGGALRDLLFGRPIRDWDIFVPWKLSIGDVRSAFPQADWKAGNEFCGEHYFDWSSVVVGTIEFTHRTTGTVAQIIWLKGDGACAMETNMLRFDWGLCRIAMNYTWTTTTAEGFWEDHNLRRFTLRYLEPKSPRVQFEHAMERYSRLKEKYPDYGLCIPAQFSQFYPGLKPTVTELKLPDQCIEF